MSLITETPTEFDLGLIVGVLVSHGSFGGDGRQPQVSLKLHVRHENLLRKLESSIPGSKLYGPYNHGNRNYYQWMVRGKALVEGLMPILEGRLTAELDAHAFDRLNGMRQNYSEWFRR
jgi:hypothetical protein